MQINLKNLKTREELGRVEALHWLHMFFVGLGLLAELFGGFVGLSIILRFILLVLFYYLFNQVKKNLYYSFWTFAGVLAFYLVVELFSHSFLSFIFWIYFWALVILCLEAYILSSPIYYPRVSWWEYDFRYRDDIKISVTVEEHSGIEGRLTDVRRGAGCVALFEELEIGGKITVDVDSEFYDVRLVGEIMSKRQYSVGRPWKYGVRFLLDGEGEKLYKDFSTFWRREKNQKRAKKFSANA